MPRPRKLTDEQVESIREWARARVTLADIARAHGVSVSTVRAIIANPNYYRVRQVVTDEELEQILRSA